MNASKEKRLGQNLTDLLNQKLPQQIDDIQKDTSRTRSFIRIKDIKPNPYQPRTNFDEAKLKELAASIKQHGIITPILVRPSGNHYEIVAGERRFRAAKLCKLEEVPVVIEKFNDHDMMEVALIENIQRADLDVIEEAQAYANIMEARNLTQQELASHIGKTRPYIANVLRLLNLPPKVRKLIAEGKISVGHARALIGLTNDQIIALAEQIQKEKLNVRETEEAARHLKKKGGSLHIKEANAIGAALKTKVTIDKKHIKIAYNSEDQLEKLVEKLTK